MAPRKRSHAESSEGAGACGPARTWAVRAGVVVSWAAAVTGLLALAGLVIADLTLNGFAHEGWSGRQTAVLAAVVLPLFALAVVAAAAARFARGRPPVRN